MHLEDIAIYISMYAQSSVLSNSLQPYGLQPSRIPCSWNSLGKNTGACCHFLLQGIFLTQGSSLHLLLCRQFPALKADSLLLKHQGSPYLYSYLCVCVCQLLSHVRLFVTPWTTAHHLFCPWNSLGKNTGVGCYFLLQGIFLSQGSNPALLHWQADSLPSESPGK